MEKKVRDISIEKNTSLRDLLDEMYEAGGFTGKKMASGLKILEKMKKEECYTFLSFPACIIATGMRGVIKDLIKKEFIDCIITTCGTLDHDLARIWKDYYHGDFNLNDAKLHKEGINRLGNVLVPNESYGEVLEEKLQEIFNGIEEKEYSSREFIWEIGKQIQSEDSIIHWAYEKKVPVFVPGITDGAFGFQLWMHAQDRELKVNPLKDETELSDIIYSAEKTGALMIGGGISKHHTIWWNQFRGGLDYAVYITTAPEWDGSLSGAKMSEAVSWGKVKEDAKYVTIEGDATIILPILSLALFQER
ncbi:MAG: deoxyhypusine synthase [Euryarchaeota archaeon]|nr:deoxyhypusine synthase [Euryarchaeota archaeon]